MSYKVTMDDIRAAGYCGNGLYGFCKRYDLDLVKLVNEGWSPEDVEAVPDEHMQRVIEIAKARAANG